MRRRRPRPRAGADPPATPTTPMPVADPGRAPPGAARLPTGADSGRAPTGADPAAAPAPVPAARRQARCHWHRCRPRAGAVSGRVIDFFWTSGVGFMVSSWRPSFSCEDVRKTENRRSKRPSGSFQP
jgi:hypothetical protein